ncbi:F0F1 ATP synthase subunit delta [Nitratifractor sp.]
MNELIAKRYAKALMEVASAEELKASLTALRAIQKSLEEKELAEIVASPLVSGEEKFSLVVEPLKGKLPEKLFNLLHLMSEKGRLNLLPTLAEILSFELKREENRYEGIVEADEALSEKELKRIAKVLKHYSGAEVQLKQVSESGDGLYVAVEDLGLELSISKSRIKADLLDFIQRAL